MELMEDFILDNPLQLIRRHMLINLEPTVNVRVTEQDHQLVKEGPKQLQVPELIYSNQEE